jgi:NAD(P)-dependent dehydrogenase (short-subunit alcohol dehydrogenase family)
LSGNDTVHIFGQLDILVNNAGSLIRRTPFADLTPEL